MWVCVCNNSRASHRVAALLRNRVQDDLRVSLSPLANASSLLCTDRDDWKVCDVSPIQASVKNARRHGRIWIAP